MRERDLKKLDAEYRAWVQTQASCISGEFDYVDGEGRCVAAHIRTARHAGVGYKPIFSCVPLLDMEHRNTHQHGEGFYHPKAWWIKQAAEYLRCWQEETRNTLPAK